ncbi:MAG: bifunctional hydroxymethylpyrimidine kinase/phosphomethylpyrimidine kinase [Opitutaceae bacterium]|nr:bifunctional hydroxymethylpyrimidine kinase/phosphomethylpyrimidine kinase [Opitutaceae bacterium]
MRPCVLTIAGSDSGAGAGIQADSRTIHALGGFALTAVTAVTAQNGRGVDRWDPVAPGLIGSQIRAALTGYPVQAAKTGLLPGRGAIEAVAAALPADLPLVVDPILGSTSGTRFLKRRDVTELVKCLLPMATLVTPNWPEAAALLSTRVETLADARRAAVDLLEFGSQAVLVKGGHGAGSLSEDVLATRSGSIVAFASVRIETANTHGTGCVLSSAIATGLARGLGCVNAIEEARRFLHLALLQGGDTEWVGKGPAFAGW